LVINTNNEQNIAQNAEGSAEHASLVTTRYHFEVVTALELHHEI